MNLFKEVDLRLAIVANMKKYGGSFVKALAEMMVLADHLNIKKIQETWPDYIERYHPAKWPEQGG